MFYNRENTFTYTTDRFGRFCAITALLKYELIYIL